ncbi:MAG: addiction module protein [Prosthecobacter sp.]|uniref:addiction module protein n=1 Tax=Prosthecobacter sp. TaxID=1965333 RepID=UPI0025FC76EE|nr:addiction module protein [Prosthecobacter sp.]MCF7784766.1 addiction module protein [Prosthecobacter sp.]
MSTEAILQAFTLLEPAQQIQLVEDMWDRIAQSDEPPPLTTEQHEELTRRKAAYVSGSSQGRSWSEVKNTLLGNDGR